MPIEPYWSASRIDTANYCGMKYYLGYVDPLKPKGENLSAFKKGSLLHNSIEKFWLLLDPEVYQSNQVLSEKVQDYFKRQGWEIQAKMEKKKYNDSESFSKYVKGQWLNTVISDKRLRENLDSKNLSEKERKKLEGRLIGWAFEGQPYIIAATLHEITEPLYNYLIIEGPPLFSELPFDFQIGELELNGKPIDAIRFKGFIDEIRFQDGKVLIRDYKSGSPWGIKEMKQSFDPQLTFYNLGLSALCYDNPKIAKLLKQEDIREQLFGTENPIYINPDFNQEFYMIEALSIEYRFNLPPPDTNDFKSGIKYQEALAKWRFTREKIKSRPDLTLPTIRSTYHFNQLVSMIEGAREINNGTRRVYPESGRKCDICNLKKPCAEKIRQNVDNVFTDKNGNRFLSFMEDPSKIKVKKSKKSNKKKTNTNLIKTRKNSILEEKSLGKVEFQKNNNPKYINQKSLTSLCQLNLISPMKNIHSQGNT